MRGDDNCRYDSSNTWLIAQAAAQQWLEAIVYLDWGDRDIRMISSQLIVFSIRCKIWALCLFDNYRYLCAETEQDMLKIMAAIVKAKVCLIVSSLKHIDVLIHHVEHKIPSCHYLWQDLRKGTTLCNFECIDFKAAYLRNTVGDLNETLVVYTGVVAVAINLKWSHSVKPQWRYEAKLMP